MAQAASLSDDANFKASKLPTARFFASKLLTQVTPLCETVKSGAGEFMSLPAHQLAA